MIVMYLYSHKTDTNETESTVSEVSPAMFRSSKRVGARTRHQFHRHWNQISYLTSL